MAGFHWQPLAKDQRLATLQLPEPGAPLPPADAQALALLIALKGSGQVAPNPLVGAVLVDAHHAFVAAGAHQRLGDQHAEIQAFDSAIRAGREAAVKGGTLYVTLEPCAHQNRTPPCAPRVAASGVRRVVYGVKDPNPLVDGKGAALLKSQGVECVQDKTWEPACRELAEVFLWNVEHRRPFVGMKVATSLDGVMAKRGDQRAFITGPRARAYGHFLRGSYDGIVIGRQTLLADNPTLDCRDALSPGRLPRRIVLDPRGTGLRNSDLKKLNLLKQSPETVLWVMAPDAPPSHNLEAFGVKVLRLKPETSGRFTAETLLTAFAAEGLSSILLEGGAGVYETFLSVGLVQRLHHFQAPRLLGGVEALHFSGASPAIAAEGPVAVTPLDPDLLLEFRLRSL